MDISNIYLKINYFVKKRSEVVSASEVFFYCFTINDRLLKDKKSFKKLIKKYSSLPKTKKVMWSSFIEIWAMERF